MGSRVSTTEPGMALLVNHAEVDFFPARTKHADAVFIPCQFVEEERYEPIVAWLADIGFDSTNVKSFHSISMCLILR